MCSYIKVFKHLESIPGKYKMKNKKIKHNCPYCNKNYKSDFWFKLHLKKHNLKLISIIFAIFLTVGGIIFGPQIIKMYDLYILGESPNLTATITYIYTLENNKSINISKENFNEIITILRNKEIVPPKFIANFTIESFSNIVEKNNKNSCILIFSLYDYGEKNLFSCIVPPENSSVCNDCLKSSICLNNHGTKSAININVRYCLKEDYFIEKENKFDEFRCKSFTRDKLFSKNESRGELFRIKKINNNGYYNLTNMVKSFEGEHDTWGVNNKMDKFYEVGLILIPNCYVKR